MDLTDEQWEVLEPRIPDPPNRRWSGQTLARPTRCPERHLVDTAYRSALEGSPGTLPSLPNLPPLLS